VLDCSSYAICGTLLRMITPPRIHRWRALLATLAGLLWHHAPVVLREGALWLLAPKFLVTVNGVCVNPHNQVLLLEQRFPRPDRWNLPGGFVQHGEHPEDTLRREIREETGLEATVTTLLWVARAPRQVHLCYLCFVPEGRPVLQSSEIMSSEWIDLASADPRRLVERQAAAAVLSHGVNAPK
jgi:ADP-ribose pyrophosphatase YjhB (NUDIX family)